jgi:hypothetical protein
MSKVMSAAARTRAERRELRQLMARVSQVAKQRLREAVEEGWLEGRVEEDGTIVVVDDAPVPTRRTRPI